MRDCKQLVSVEPTSFLEQSRGTKVMERKKVAFHELYLQPGSIASKVPIQFEDGMDWVDCERYYALIADGSLKSPSLPRNAGHRRVRCPSKRDLEQEMRSELRSCLRTCSNRWRRKDKPRMQRSLSFNTLRHEGSSYSTFYAEANCELIESPRVTFSHHVAVVTIRPIDDYPEEICKLLWMSADEIDKGVRNAMREEFLVDNQAEEEDAKECSNTENDRTLEAAPKNYSFEEKGGAGSNNVPLSETFLPQ